MGDGELLGKRGEGAPKSQKLGQSGQIIAPGSFRGHPRFVRTEDGGCESVMWKIEKCIKPETRVGV